MTWRYICITLLSQFSFFSFAFNFTVAVALLPLQSQIHLRLHLHLHSWYSHSGRLCCWSSWSQGKSWRAKDCCGPSVVWWYGGFHIKWMIWVYPYFRTPPYFSWNSGAPIAQTAHGSCASASADRQSGALICLGRQGHSCRNSMEVAGIVRSVYTFFSR